MIKDIGQKVNREGAAKPIWLGKSSVPHIYVATPVHDQVSIHFTQSILDFQKYCFQNKLKVTFQLVKSSLVTQGRNLCVADFLTSGADYLLFIDSDIEFEPGTIQAMIDKDKELISAPYPLKNINWKKAFEKIQAGDVKTLEDLSNAIYQYPLRVPNEHDISMHEGIIEVTHGATGCMLIKRSVFDKLMKAYPDKTIVQKTVMNGELVDKDNLWNFFDTLYDSKTKMYMGEDFAFCKLWKDIGGKCYSYVLDPITHVGEFKYSGRFADELIINK
jgi:hypothetical protein